MSDQIASLGIEIGSDGVIKADKALRQLTQTTKDAEKSTKGLEAAWASSERRLKTEVLSRGDTIRREQVKTALTGTAATVRAEKERSALQIAELRRSLSTQREIIRSEEAARRRIILANTEITERERAALLKRNVAKARSDLAANPETSFARRAANTAGLAGGVAVVAGLHEVVAVNREFDKLSATLVTVMGSTAAAKAAFSTLQDVASTTPNTLQEMVEAFTKLNAYGLNPSERALRSYTDTSSAMGKGLLQMVEAVADAQTGEFERLKEFGIRASQQGDRVKLTFKGVTTTVGKNAREIEEYLIRLGEVNFAGAAAERMKTLDGAITNLGDEWSKLVRTIGEGSVGDLIKDSVTTAIGALKDLSAFLRSDTANAMALWVRKAATYVAGVTDIGGTIVKGSLTGIGYKDLPAAISRARDTVAGIENDMAGEEWRKRLYAGVDAEQAVFGLGGQGTQTSGLPATYAGVAPTPRSMGKSKAALAAAKKARAEANREEDRARKEEEQRYRKAMQDDKALRAQRQRETDAEIKQEIADAETLRRSLQTPREQLTERYWQDRGVLERGAGSADDQARLDKQYQKDMEAIERSDEAKRRALSEGFQTEAQQLADAQSLRKQMIDDAYAEELISAEQHADLLTKLQKDTLDKQRAMDAARVESSLTSASAIFGGLAESAKNIGGEQSGAYRTLFNIQKAFAIASGTTAMYTAMADGMRKGWPEGIPLMLSAAAQGANLLAQITSTNYAGAFGDGGRIPAGSVGLVGERGQAELVRGPATVVSGNDTAALLGGGRTTVRVITAPDMRSAEQFLATPAGERAFVALVQRNAATIKEFTA